MRSRLVGIVLVVVGLGGLIGTFWVGGTRRGPAFGMRLMPFGAGGWTCTPPPATGQRVDVTLSDMGGMMRGGMMRGGRMMSVTADPPRVDAGEVSFRAWNAGMMVHEMIVLPLPPGGPGTRSVGSDGRVSEEGSLGEVSKSCGEGAGEGIAPGAAGWVSLRLTPGRYELICNLPGHYAAGMFTELDAR